MTQKSASTSNSSRKKRLNSVTLSPSKYGADGHPSTSSGAETRNGSQGDKVSVLIYRQNRQLNATVLLFAFCGRIRSDRV